MQPLRDFQWTVAEEVIRGWRFRQEKQFFHSFPCFRTTGCRQFFLSPFFSVASQVGRQRGDMNTRSYFIDVRGRNTILEKTYFPLCLPVYSTSILSLLCLWRCCLSDSCPAEAAAIRGNLPLGQYKVSFQGSFLMSHRFYIQSAVVRKGLPRFFFYREIC